MAAPRASLLGPPQLWDDGQVVPWLPERRFQLLALLALQSGQWLARDRIAALLWPGHEPAQGRRNLRKVVLRARELPGTQSLQANDHALCWSIETDLQAFKAAVEGGRALEAMALGRGPLLAGLDAADAADFNDWLAGERRYWAEAWRQAALAAAHGAATPAERSEIAQRMLAVDPLDEGAIDVALRAEMALGQAQRAQRLYAGYAERLAEAFGVEPSAALRELMARPTAKVHVTPAHTPAAEPRDDGFIGRKLELNELALLLARDDCRLLTVLGPGGVGKSSLARQAMTRLAPAIWIELHDLDSTAALLARIAHSLGVQLPEAADALATIARQVDDAPRRLLVLDNGEHLDGLPALLERLIGATRSLRVLLTSRTRCHIAHEWVLPLAGLAVPDEDSRDLDAAAAFDALRLFQRRATAAQRDFELAPHLDAVIAIVEAVAGLPLAIELAAGWVRLLPAPEIARELQQTIDVLERDPATAAEPARPEHASMRAVLERSWQLLAPRERDALTALSVFHGGFTRRAAMEVAAVPLPLLSSLADKSFLQVDDTGRFAMHPLVAADAAARARADAARHAGHLARHAEHFAQQLADLAARHGSDHRPIVAALEAERANCERAWAHAITSQRPEAVLKMVPAWQLHSMAGGRFEDGKRHFEAALALADTPDAAHARATVRAVLARLAVSRHDTDQAQALAREALLIAERIGATRLVADCVLTLGVACAEQLRYTEAKPWFERALQVAAAHGHRAEQARALSSLGTLASRCGEFDDSLAHHERALAAFRDLGDHTNVTRILQNVGIVHMAQADWLAARGALETALRHALAHDVRSLLPPIEFSLGATLIELGGLDAAADHLGSARERCRALKYASYEIKTDYYLARIAGRRGAHAEAARSHLAAARQAHASGWTLDLHYIALFVGELLRDLGHGADARRIWRSLAASPVADQSLAKLVQACLHALPAAGQDTRPAAPDIPFDALVSHLAHGADLADLLARLGAAAAPPEQR